MAGHGFGGEAAAALVFLILYTCVFCVLIYGFLTKHIKWASRWSFVLFHVVMRLASQACGVAFGVLGFSNVGVFIAYLVLAAEGYFTLVLVGFRFLVSWQERNRFNQVAWLEPRLSKEERKKQAVEFYFLLPILYLFWPKRLKQNPMACVHIILIAANVLIVIGGSYLAGTTDSDKTLEEQDDLLHLSKILRTTGQAIFLALNCFLGVALLMTMVELHRKRDFRQSRRTHPTLFLLFAAWLFLLVRGIWGVLQSAVWSLNYFAPQNYTPHGFTPRFTALENCLSVMTEWIPVCLICLTYLTSRGDPSRPKEGEENKLEEVPSSGHSGKQEVSAGP